jgi:hypothetical protein
MADRLRRVITFQVCMLDGSRNALPNGFPVEAAERRVGRENARRYPAVYLTRRDVDVDDVRIGRGANCRCNGRPNLTEGRHYMHSCLQ